MTGELPAQPRLTERRNSARLTAKSPGSEIFSEGMWAEIARSLKLSRRELQVVRGVFDDRTGYHIANELGISPHAVHTYLDRLHRKLGVVDRVQLLLCIMREFVLLTISSLQPPAGSAPATEPAT
jgi:DNA-binding NarL/FixJ family response regulator